MHFPHFDVQNERRNFVEKGNSFLGKGYQKPVDAEERTDLQSADSLLSFLSSVGSIFYLFCFA